MKTQRTLLKAIPGTATADGAGVKLTRLIGTAELDMLDPFLLLDCFESDQSEDYIGGFPEHPHRGFETVTYLLNGKMRHKDSAGNEGIIEPGGVQWMTAGRGILHSEMPEQVQGLMKGFQLWVNLPAKAKMIAPAYQEYSPDSVPVEQHENGSQIAVIAGKTDLGTTGPVLNPYTSPTYLDITLSESAMLQQTLPATHNAFIYMIEGELSIGDANQAEQRLSAKTLGLLSQGEQVEFKATSKGARFLLIAGEPLNEPVARGGPFVMNTKAEIVQAFADFHAGRF